MKKKQPHKKEGLTDKQLIEKYDKGGVVNFDRALKKMSQSPSPTTISKQKK